jgi:plastocyanin
MLRKFIFALVGIAATLPSTVAAKDQLVIITDFGFFPQVSYVQPGDTVYFENTSEISLDLGGGQNASELWTLSVPANTTASLHVTGVTGLIYNSTNVPLIPAEFSFAEPPAGAQAD